MLISLGLSDEEVGEVIKRKIVERRKAIEVEKLVKEYASKMYRTIESYETIFAQFAMEIQNVK
jgi:hypothetical protein